MTVRVVVVHDRRRFVDVCREDEAYDHLLGLLRHAGVPESEAEDAVVGDGYADYDWFVTELDAPGQA